MSKPKRSYRKLLLYTCLSILFLFVSGLILLFVFLDDIVDSRIKQLISKKFGTYYDLKFDEIQKDIGFSEITFVVKEAQFSSDTTNVEGVQKFPIMFFHANEIRIEKLSTWDVIWGNEIDLESISLVSPDFRLYINKNLEVAEESDQQGQTRKGLLSFLRLNLFNLEDGHLEVHDFNQKKRILLNDSINIQIHNIDLDMNNLDDVKEAINWKDFQIETFKTVLTPVEGFYQFSLDSLRINGGDHATIGLSNMVVETKKSLKEVSQTKINHKEVANLFLGQVEVEGFNIDELLKNDRVSIEKVRLKDALIEIFKNKTTKMEASYRKKILNEVFRGIHFPVHIDSILIENTQVLFELMATRSRKPAKIDLKIVDGKITGFNTNPSDLDTIKIRIDSKLMKKGNLVLNADIAIFDSVSNYQKFWGHLSDMPFAVMNPTIQNFVNIKIHDGHVQRVDFVGYANRDKSWGNIAFRYKDLSMDIYSFKDKSTKRKNKFLSNIAKLAIHKTNPLPNGDFRQAHFEYKRERWEGSVMLWLGGILEGMFRTTLKDVVLDVLIKEEQRKIQKELHRKTKQEHKAEKKRLRAEKKEERKRKKK